LFAQKPKIQKWGFIVGLSAQPFWIMETFSKEQWGIFLISWWYAFSYCLGIYRYWIKKVD
jgi:hypothetical protein